MRRCTDSLWLASQEAWEGASPGPHWQVTPPGLKSLLYRMRLSSMTAKVKLGHSTAARDPARSEGPALPTHLPRRQGHSLAGSSGQGNALCNVSSTELSPCLHPEHLVFCPCFPQSQPSPASSPQTQAGPRHCPLQASPLPWGSRSPTSPPPNRHHPPPIGLISAKSSPTPVRCLPIWKTQCHLRLESPGSSLSFVCQASTYHPAWAPAISSCSRDLPSGHLNPKGHTVSLRRTLYARGSHGLTHIPRSTPTLPQPHRPPPRLGTLSHTKFPVKHTPSLTHAYSHPHTTRLNYTLIRAQRAFHSVPGETLKSEVNLHREITDVSTLAEHLPTLAYCTRAHTLTRAHVSYSPSEGKWKNHIGSNAKQGETLKKKSQEE